VSVYWLRQWCLNPAIEVSITWTSTQRFPQGHCAKQFGFINISAVTCCSSPQHQGNSEVLVVENILHLLAQVTPENA